MSRYCFKGVLLGSLAPLLVSGMLISPAHANSQIANAKPTIANFAPILVSGVLPGPALWKVTKGAHVMWVLGVTKPLPKKMQWETSAIERAVMNSQAVLKAPGMEVGARVGFWGRLFLIPSMIGIKKLPDDKTLRDVLAPELYTRWETQRARYLGGTWGADRLRPIFAGEKLYAAAIMRSGLTNDGGVEERVFGLAKHDNVPVVDTSYLVIMEDPRGDAKRFKQVSMDDQRCLSGILDATEQDLSQATVRANLWATGDMAALRKVLAVQQQDECLSAVGNTDFAKKIGMTDITQRIKDAWLKAAEASLEKNQQTTALLPIEKMLAPDGYLSALQAKGYVVTSPQE